MIIGSKPGGREGASCSTTLKRGDTALPPPNPSLVTSQVSQITSVYDRYTKIARQKLPNEWA